MKIRSWKVSPDGLTEKGKWIAASMNKGCGLDECGCSPGYWITVSDGETVINVKLNKGEGERFVKTGVIG
jgi:hypothetical protein